MKRLIVVVWMRIKLIQWHGRMERIDKLIKIQLECKLKLLKRLKIQRKKEKNPYNSNIKFQDTKKEMIRKNRVT